MQPEVRLSRSDVLRYSVRNVLASIIVATKLDEIHLGKVQLGLEVSFTAFKDSFLVELKLSVHGNNSNFVDLLLYKGSELHCVLDELLVRNIHSGPSLEVLHERSGEGAAIVLLLQILESGDLPLGVRVANENGRLFPSLLGLPQLATEVLHGATQKGGLTSKDLVLSVSMWPRSLDRKAFLAKVLPEFLRPEMGWKMLVSTLSQTHT